MHKLVSSGLIVAVGASCVLALSGCSTGMPTISGAWKASDGSSTKTISTDGNCTNMLYTGAPTKAAVYVTDNPGMCHLRTKTGADTYTLEVHQKPYDRTYTATFSNGDKTMKLSRGGTTFVTLTRTTSAD